MARPSASLSFSAAREGSSGTVELLRRVFRYLDDDGDEKISPAELRRCMLAVGGENDVVLLTEEEVEEVVRSSDYDGDGLLGFDDFVKLVDVEDEQAVVDLQRRNHLWDAFRVYVEEDDRRKVGEDDYCCITPRSLRRALDRLGESKTDDECAAMISRFDLNGDGVISFDEFAAMMQVSC